jgi:hypothetical protein
VIEVGGGGALLRYSTPEGQPLGSLDEAGLVKLSEVNGMCAESLKSEANPTGAPPPFFFFFLFLVSRRRVTSLHAWCKFLFAGTHVACLILVHAQDKANVFF